MLAQFQQACFTLSEQSIPTYYQRRGCTHNMASPTLCQKRFTTDYPTPTPLEFYHSSQTALVTSRNARICEGLRAITVVFHIPCSVWSNAYVGQRVKEHKGARRREDGNTLLVLHCLATDHAFDWERTSVNGKGTTRHTCDFTEAWKTNPSPLFVQPPKTY